MDASSLDVIVIDGHLGALAVGYLLASRGRRVGVVDRSPPSGTTAVNILSARRLEALRDLIDQAPPIGRRMAVVLQPEGGMSVGMASDRFADPTQAIAIIDRSDVATALIAGVRKLGGRLIPEGDLALVDASGLANGVRAVDGEHHPARCTVLNSTEGRRLNGIRDEMPTVPASALETEWRYELDAEIVRARFATTDLAAAEWWFYGDLFDRAQCLARIRAFGSSVSLGVVMPMDQVLERRIDIADLGKRLSDHPFVAPLVEGGVPTGVTAGVSSMVEPRPDELVGDGWVLGPVAHPFDAVPLSTEIAMAEVIADVIDGALQSGRVTSARLSAIPKRLQRLAKSAMLRSPGPIDGWADELVSDPTKLVDGLRSMAVRFGGAG